MDVAVVGAGMAGLMAARRLGAEGLRVAVFDKAKGVGGRMATRRLGDAVFDLGAQYFTARDPSFIGWVEEWLASGLIRSWSTGFGSAEGTYHDNGEPRYVGLNGMTTVPKRLAESLRVHLTTTASSCAWIGDRWRIEFKERSAVMAGQLVLTPPVPQALELLQAGGVALDDGVAEALGRIEYLPCLAALVRLTGPSQVPAPGGLWLEGEPVRWIADNAQKGISAERLGASVTVHAGPEFTRAHWDADPDATGALMAAAVEPWLGSEVAGVRVHRWRYSTPAVLHPDRCLATSVPGPLVFAGDAFGEARVEGAALSGWAAAAALLGVDP